MWYKIKRLVCWPNYALLTTRAGWSCCGNIALQLVAAEQQSTQSFSTEQQTKRTISNSRTQKTQTGTFVINCAQFPPTGAGRLYIRKSIARVLLLSVIWRNIDKIKNCLPTTSDVMFIPPHRIIYTSSGLPGNGGAKVVKARINAIKSKREVSNGVCAF